MKKLSVILVALVAIFAVSCKKSDPFQKMVDAIGTFTEKLQKVDSQEALLNLQKEMDALKAYMGEKDNANTEKTAETKTEANTGISVGNSVGVSLSIGG